MGESQSKLPPRPQDFEYMCINTGSADKVCIILGTDHETEIIRHVIKDSWPPGIQEESLPMNGVHQFKLKGSPFYFASSSTDAARCRKMVGNILNKLCRDGWRLQIAGNYTQTTDFTTWIFKKDPTAVCPSLPFLTVGLNSMDSLLVLNAPIELHQMFKDVIDNSWPKGIRKWTYKNGVLKIKLKENPWCADGKDTIRSKAILYTLVNELRIRQWKLYGNTNLRSRANSLFFEHVPNMVHGLQSFPAHFAISFSSEDLIRLVGISEGLVAAVRNTIQSFWSRGIQRDERYADSIVFKLRGTPWCTSGEEAVNSRFVVIKLMEALQACGWIVAANVNCSRKTQDKSSLLFRQSQPRQSPVFCISLNETDKLRLINAPDDVREASDDVILIFSSYLSCQFVKLQEIFSDDKILSHMESFS